jgi:hypothetical protein
MVSQCGIDGEAYTIHYTLYTIPEAVAVYEAAHPLPTRIAHGTAAVEVRLEPAEDVVC